MFFYSKDQGFVSFILNIISLPKFANKDFIEVEISKFSVLKIVQAPVRSFPSLVTAVEKH